MNSMRHPRRIEQKGGVQNATGDPAISRKLKRHRWRFVLIYWLNTPLEARMKIASHITDDALLKRIGGRLARLRLTKNLTQQQLAEQAGLRASHGLVKIRCRS